MGSNGSGPAYLAKMIKKYYHKKLIRDKIPEIIETSGGNYKIKVLGNTEFEKK